jgi:Mrp family chromosome partitioning ATPase
VLVKNIVVVVVVVVVVLLKIDLRKKGILDVDVCGPSVPRIMRVSDAKIINTDYGWIPAK